MARGGLRCPLALIRLTAHGSWDRPDWGVPAASFSPTWVVPAASCSPTRYFLDMSAKGKLWLSQLSERKKEYFYC